MDTNLRGPSAAKRIALIAHDNEKADLTEWCAYNRSVLARHELFATDTTGRMLRKEVGLDVSCLRSGPFGGDQQIGARIADGTIDILFFFWDPFESHSHDPDIKALLRLAVVWNIPLACNRATADYLISSPLLTGRYERRTPEQRAELAGGGGRGGLG
ncbi:MAG TPA: methylglyoxal synthase [Mycobacteriales bacterium]|jgi:methylglyoxal synthase|nr:methylglyoxal synthase [Mycobacteriales bacterium]